MSDILFFNNYVKVKIVDGGRSIGIATLYPTTNVVLHDYRKRGDTEYSWFVHISTINPSNEKMPVIAQGFHFNDHPSDTLDLMFESLKMLRETSSD